MTILTGDEIHRQWRRGLIRIEPFDQGRLNPNSYNFTLDNRLRVYTTPVLDARTDNPTVEITIPEEGFVLDPGRLYLAATAEVLGGTAFAPTFAARSSVARLGLSIHLSSGLGDIGYEGRWTLQLLATEAVRVYPGMEIGQMMWWAPFGEVNCYDGKYQGASGPRASESWRTLDPDLARIRFPGLDDPNLDLAQVGAKFANLARLAGQAAVPPAVVAPVTEFEAAIAPAVREEIAAIFSDLHATVGANLTEDITRLDTATAGLKLSDRASELLAARIDEIVEPGTSFAVRSSAVGEDSATVSHAGVYDSLLGVTAADLAAAVAAVWRSYYSLTAVGARLRGGDLDPAPRMAVIIQQMIEPDTAGIAMTGLDPSAPQRVEIEHTTGRGDRLVAGLTEPGQAPALSPADVAQIHQLIGTAATTMGHASIDIEWAQSGGRIYLLQARPNTAPPAPDHRTQPAVIELYDQDIPSDIPLGPIAEACGHFLAKRRRAAKLATELGINRGAAFVVYIPARCDPGWHAVLAAHLDAALAGERVIVDANEFERQILTDYAGLHGHLARLRAATPPAEPLTVLVRQYVTGRCGVITHRDEVGTQFYGEASTDGLLAINRGSADCVGFEFGAVRRPDPEVLDLLGGSMNIDLITQFTERLQALLGPVTVEWVLEGDRLFYVDHTVLGGQDTAAPALARQEEAVTISPGRGVGTVLKLTDDDVLQRLSIAPAVSVSGGVDVSGHRVLTNIVARIQQIKESGVGVIVCARRPYAILAALVGHADGFLFEHGSRLCHLAIILRENRIPAAIHCATEGDTVMLDDGLVYSITGGSRT
ncbi:dCTP deaminase domain-containing protein [Nocardia brasiliensis]|uniref:dCTP deaminase domain-containing protein n=1 Tax=Nocardia brasiliensis TaxID=37326 RepID=UPI0024590F8E|nr:PEP/pyruvate-binding domain-containing protein [Nocardia brasiliensis]